MRVQPCVAPARWYSERRVRWGGGKSSAAVFAAGQGMPVLIPVLFYLGPPLAQHRLELRPDGRLKLTLKDVWRDGTRAVVFEPHDFMARLVAAIPPPKFHLLRYFGILSSHSAPRSEVVPEPLPDRALRRPPPAEGDQLELFEQAEAPPQRKRWAWLLQHVFRADLDTCPKCGGPMRWIEAASTRKASERLLAKLGLAPQPPPVPVPRSEPLGQLKLRFTR